LFFTIFQYIYPTIPVKMRTEKLLLFLICLLFGIPTAHGGSKIATVPFQVIGSYVVIEVRINDSTPINLILDSGVNSTLITELTSEDSLALNFAEKNTIKGLGAGVTINAYRSVGNLLHAGKMKIHDQTVYILEEDIFNLSKHVGQKVNGLLGSDFFENHVVQIDYNKRLITFYDNETFVAPDKYVGIPMITQGHKMFIKLPVTGPDWVTKNALMLLDTGAELTAWFRSYGENPIKIPDKHIRGYIGQGLNGEIKGYMGRISLINIDGHALENPIVAFPDSATITDAILNTKREGTIGSQILSRFNLIFDQYHNKLYLKPNMNFKRPFHYNVAGIEIMQESMSLKLPIVVNVRENSPADKAGVKIGDQLIKINELNGFSTDINEVKKEFETKSRMPLQLTVSRKGKTMNFKVDMKGEL